MWAWLQSIFNAVFNALPAPLRRLWQFLVDFKTKTLGIFDNIHTLVSSVETEVNAIRNFQVDIKWRTRVISAPVAVQTIQDFFTAFPDIIDQIKSLAEEVRNKINVPETTFNPDEVEGLRLRPTKLIQIGEKLAGWASLIIDALSTIEQAIDQLQAIVNDVHTIRTTIENMDGIFLPQGNPKKTVDERYRKRQRG